MKICRPFNPCVLVALSCGFLLTSSHSLNGNPFFTLFDDAMISMCYARTLAETGQFVWFPGAPRVQGFTNIGWTLYMAFLHALGFTGSTIAFLISITGIFCIWSVSVLLPSSILNYIPLEGEKKKALGGFAMSISLLFPLIFWSIRGMEVGALTLCAALFFTSLLKLENDHKSRIFSSVTLALSSSVGCIVRLDFSIIPIVGSFVFYCLTDGGRELRRIIVFNTILVVATVVAMLLFQYHYYGAAVPNTYTLKVSGHSLYERLIRGSTASANILPLITLVLISCYTTFYSIYRKLQKVIFVAAAIFFACVAYSIWVGGDAWEASRIPNRYVTIAIPFAFLTIFMSLDELVTRSKDRYQRAIFVTIFLVGSMVQCLVDLVDLNQPAGIILGLFFLSGISFIEVISVSQPRSFNNSFFCVILLTLITGSWGYLQWYANGGFNGGYHVRDDFAVTQQAIAMSSVTKHEAVIATVWAGAPGYYINRKMIDLLGKSDLTVASLKPRVAMIPGHDKWDYDYSIGILRPDAVFQLWRATPGDIDKLKSWGYQLFCYGNGWQGYFLENSPNIDWSQLRACAV